MNRRVIGVIVALILAGLGTWAIINYVQGADERAIEGQEVTEVLVVTAPIEAGTSAEDIANAVTLAERREVDLEAVVGEVESLDTLAGLVATVDLEPGEIVLASRFAEPESFRQFPEVEVPEDLFEVTVELAPERVLGGELVPGERVAIVASFQPFTLDAVEPTSTEDLQDFIDQPVEVDGGTEAAALRTPDSSHIIADRVLVTNLQFGQAPETTDAEGDTPAQALSPRGSLLVTVALDAPQVEQLVFTQEFGSVWLARGESAATGTEITTRGTVYQ